MKREAVLQRKLHTLRTLQAAVGAMRPLAAHHFRLARAQLLVAREYRAGVEQAVAGLKLALPPSLTGVPGMLVIAAELGLCGGYTSRLVEAALAYGRQLGIQRVYCVGHRAVPLLSRAGVLPVREYPAPTDVRAIPGLLLRLVEELIGVYLAGDLSSFHVVSARFEGVGVFTPICTQVLPIRLPPPSDAVPPSPYVRAEYLAVVAVRELLYILLHELLLEALASEHGARLVATESASEWLEDRLGSTRRLLSALRREAATQEVLAIVSGSRQQARQEGQRSPGSRLAAWRKPRP